MNTPSFPRFVISLLLYPWLLSVLCGAIRLPGIVGDGMVLQRDTSLTIWGWADPGEAVSVRFVGNEASVVADKNGDWSVSLIPLPAGGPHTMELVASNRIVLNDILIGDVWFASGQSNMAHQFNRWQEDYAEEILHAENASIRQIFVPTTPALPGPLQDIPNLKWRQADPPSILDFTVVGYFFAKTMWEQTGVPQGIIMSTVGGTPVEAWTSESGFEDASEILKLIAANKDEDHVVRVNAAAQAERDAVSAKQAPDAGLEGAIPWYDLAYEPQNWRPIHVPGFWEDQGLRNLDGVVWYRREVEVPDSMIGAEVLVKLGRIRDADELFVNGTKVGQTYYEYPQRRYSIPAGLLKPGKNLFVVRIQNNSGKGGFIPDKPYHIEAQGQQIDLTGTWHYRVGVAYRPHGMTQHGIHAQNQPAALFNGMVAPFTNYALKGALWYQGESNISNADRYASLLQNMIQDWRQHWDNPNLLFIIAQLPNFGDIDFLPVESGWAVLREAQWETARNTSNAGLGINIDLGEWNDIHPANKHLVGQRLAIQAMSLLADQKENMVATGPTLRSFAIKENRIILSFDHVGSGLVSSDGEALAHFAIAGEDKKFVWGQAVIEGDKVLVSSPEIPNPRYVRYAWADNPLFANLANKEGFPAAPFRTDR